MRHIPDLQKGQSNCKIRQFSGNVAHNVRKDLRRARLLRVRLLRQPRRRFLLVVQKKVRERASGSFYRATRFKAIQESIVEADKAREEERFFHNPLRENCGNICTMKFARDATPSVIPLNFFGKINEPRAKNKTATSAESPVLRFLVYADSVDAEACWMKVLVSGGSGLVGTALTDSLRREGHTVAQLVRPGGETLPGDIRWDPASGFINTNAMEDADAVVNLNGASIGGGRWTSARKKILHASRIGATRILVDAFTRLKQKPRVFISASAIGYYGNRGDEALTESSAAGNDFLATVTREWETEALRAQSSGIRTVLARFGIILSAKGGALKQIVPPFKLGLRGRLGSGQQWMSWVAIDDVVGILT